MTATQATLRADYAVPTETVVEFRDGAGTSLAYVAWTRPSSTATSTARTPRPS